jgi:protein-S-isoprenylcysteine O-methyltransferase Ste14
MALREEFEKQGNWLFVRRSWFPILIFPLLFYTLRYSDNIEIYFGTTAQIIYEIFCVIVSLSGLYVRAFTIAHAPAGTSGRNTKEGQVAEKLNTTGIYSIVRHPLYLGNFLIFFGFVLFTQSPWFIALSVLAFWIYYERIMFAEEEFLRRKYGEQYEKWAAGVPAFWPKFGQYSKPDLPFSVRNVLKREYTAFFEITLIFPLLDIIARYIHRGRVEPDYYWLAFFALGFVTYFTLRTLKKKTKILHVEGR